MRLRLGIGDRIPLPDMRDALNAALEASTISQVPLIEAGEVPTFERGLRTRGVKWRPEPPGDEHFDSARTVMIRGWGDCDDLAPWHAASLRATGEDPEAQAIVKRSGPQRWHALVRRGDGSIDDPSIAAGMRGRSMVSGVGAMGIFPPVWPAMFRDGRCGVAVHPWERGWASRVDVPDRDLPVAWSGIATAMHPHRAAAKAIAGVLDTVNCVDGVCGYEADRLGALHDILLGHDPRGVFDDFANTYGEEEAVGFLPIAAALAPTALKAAGGMFGGMFGGKKGGGGSPSAAMAQPATSPMAPGSTLMMPGGTTIVRF